MKRTRKANCARPHGLHTPLHSDRFCVGIANAVLQGDVDYHVYAKEKIIDV